MKIFIVGFNKSGTRTLHHFFYKNGFKAVHWDFGNLAIKMVKNCIENKNIFHGYDRKYSVFSDMIFLNQHIHIEGNQFFKKMDKDYPDSYFIYNYRNIDNWLNSRLNHRVNSKDISFIDRYKEIYGESNDLILERWRDNRISFEKNLFAHFHGSKRLLKLNIDDDNNDQVALISNFLGVKMNADYWKWLGRTGERIKHESILSKLSKKFKRVFGIFSN